MRRELNSSIGRLLSLVVALAGCATDSEQPTAPSFAKASPAPNPEIAWSNDGLWVMNADGSNQARIIPGSWVGNPTWAPVAPGATRFRIAYSDISLTQIDLIEVTTTGGVIRGGTPRLLATAAADPAWSPLGDEIAYVADLPDGSGRGVWTMDTIGNGRAVIPQTVLPGGVMRPTWRSDGLALAFWQDRDSIGSPYHKKIHYITRATRNDPWSSPAVVYLDPNPNAGNALDWARTKNVLAFTAGQANAALELLDLTTLKVDTVGFGMRPSWSPDDKYLASYSSGLTKLELSTRRETILARRVGCCRPSWRR